MPITPIEFLNYFTKDRLFSIANNLGIYYDYKILKNDLINLIIENYFPNDLLNKRKLKNILTIFYKYELKRIFSILDISSQYNRMNSHEFVNFLADKILSYEEEVEEEEEEEEEVYYEPEDFLKVFAKDDLKSIARYWGIEYNRNTSIDDLMELISNNFFPQNYLTRNGVKKILKVFYKEGLRDICRYMGVSGFYKLNVEELKDFIIEIFHVEKEGEEEYENIETEEEDSEYEYEEDEGENENEITVLFLGAQPNKTTILN